MEGYYRTAVIEMIITVGFGMTASRDALNGRIIETAWRNTWLTLLLERTSEYFYDTRKYRPQWNPACLFASYMCALNLRKAHTCTGNLQVWVKDK